MALSVGSPRPAVSWHLALWSPDFPHAEARDRLARSRMVFYHDRYGSKVRKVWNMATCALVGAVDFNAEDFKARQAAGEFD